ncbi:MULTISPECIES: glutamine-hydrolyzing GMP synthase [Auritidibacter]|uniref:glutamine-hydrolyzing GMP synthase n=1 Tax=Auritidibacter TaxID=1160973 RepID=UPI000D73EFF9|nr:MULTISPECIES: glutamine-hydrolyzing GMP synthase [Auritidibacter]PXA78129.1 GMP synthase (glutamine-hydrolyzing) [Auritidibacter sp. NML100628]WHS28467.1 glutamine-hydrolyzing GMP synthase [Auritidibacter ignavus]
MTDPSRADNPDIAADFPTVLVVDFGAQYAQLIARRVREAHVYSEVVAHSTPVQEIVARKPAALILSGGPSSAYEDGAPGIDPDLLEAGIPVLGLCYGFQAITQALGGTVARTERREYGSTPLTSLATDSVLLADQPADQTVWMSHSDAVSQAPEGFTVIASTPHASVAAFENTEKKIFGVQWHPEVKHTPFGQDTITNFLYHGAGLRPEWTTSSVIDEQVQLIKDQVGDARAICGLSGGVDSAVAAALVQRAIGDRLTCVYVNHGLMRHDESVEIERAFGTASGGARLVMLDAEGDFLQALSGVSDPEAKRKIIGEKFIRTFERAQAEIVAETADQDLPPVEFLVQGTVYPDIVESGGGDGTAVIKSHHNVGGLPDDIEFELVEPLRALFKDEVRAVGTELGLPDEIVWRQPFPGPGLGIRIIGEVTKERLDTLRAADAIVRAELTAAGLDREIWQCPVVLLADVRSVGVQGDARTYGHPIVLRPVVSDDAMTADWAKVPYDVLSKISNRITNEVDEINRVVLDVTSKPPGTIEWE